MEKQNSGDRKLFFDGESNFFDYCQREHAKGYSNPMDSRLAAYIRSVSDIIDEHDMTADEACEYMEMLLKYHESIRNREILA